LGILGLGGGRTGGITRSGITRRRREFLKKLQELCADNGGRPVHYVDVAAGLGVSKWTAYDMLQELVKDGYASVTYSVPREEGAAGRSQILFCLTKEGRTVLESAPPQREEWQVLRRRLLERIDSERRKGAVGLPALLDEISASNLPFEFCGGLLLSLVLYLESMALPEIEAARAVLALSSGVRAGALIFVGLAARVLLGNSDAVSERLKALLCRFHVFFEQMDEPGQHALSGFLRETLNGGERN